MCDSHSRNFSRRSFLRHGIGAWALAGLPAASALDPARLDRRIAHTVLRDGPRIGNLDLALEAARWIHRTRVARPNGVTWPADPATPGSEDIGLYHGAPGVVLFLLELHAATGDEDHLLEATRGAEHLMGVVALDAWVPAGLYSGLAGIGYTLSEVARSAGGDPYRSAARQAYQRILDHGRDADGGVLWYRDDPESATYDIVSGAAGTGLGLLHAARELELEGAVEVAARAGEHLLAVGRSAGTGLKWSMSPSYPRLMPNFSHGTAGVAFFLARLYQETGRTEFLEGATAGARYLEAASACEQEGCLVFHHEPEGEDLFYLSWCHGPAGTARLFYTLAEATGDAKWMRWVHQGARGIRNLGVPEHRSPGYWNNVSQCCGDSGVGEFFLALHGVTGERSHLDFASHLGTWVADHATVDGTGARWVQAENRVDPEGVVAQTGWMQGAAGMGAFLLHLEAAQNGRAPRITLPDSPWST